MKKLGSLLHFVSNLLIHLSNMLEGTATEPSGKTLKSKLFK